MIERSGLVQLVGYDTLRTYLHYRVTSYQDESTCSTSTQLQIKTFVDFSPVITRIH